MKEESRDYYKQVLLSLLPQNKAEAIPGPELSRLMHLSYRAIKQIITELRLEHPICSQETGAGGYWMAENSQDIIEFVKMIERRRDAYNKTIQIMSHHIFNERK